MLGLVDSRLWHQDPGARGDRFCLVLSRVDERAPWTLPGSKFLTKPEKPLVLIKEFEPPRGG